MFSHIIGNDPIKGYLSRMLHNETIANSLLFAGAAGIGKSLFAEAFAAELLSAGGSAGIARKKVASGNHPDLHIFRPEGKIAMHTIASMRLMSREVWLPPYEAGRKVFIIHDAERMLAYSANALLKTFEEPPLDAVIILLSSAPELILPTIVSRCRAIYFQRLSCSALAALLKQQRQLSDADALKVAQRSQGSLQNALRLCDNSSGGDQLQKSVVELLARGRVATYGELSNAAKALALIVEGEAKKCEAAARSALYEDFAEKPTALQKESIDKELEGHTTMQLLRSSDALFDNVLGWFRDLSLLSVGGSRDLLLHCDHVAALESALQRGGQLPVEEVIEAVKDAKLSLARSTPLHLCLENLFLRIDLY